MRWARFAAFGGALALAVATSGCGAIGMPGNGLPDHPHNPQAIPPIVLIAQASSPGGEYRAFLYNTSDGMTCFEVDQRDAGGSGCGPTGSDPGGGRQTASNSGFVMSGSTTNQAAVRARIHDAAGPDVEVGLTSGDPVVPGTKFWVAGFAAGANPVSVDFLDKDGTKVDGADLGE